MDLAKLNHEYYALAVSEPLAISLLNFGLFTGAQPADVPKTMGAQPEIGMRITRHEPLSLPAPWSSGSR